MTEPDHQPRPSGSSAGNEQLDALLGARPRSRLRRWLSWGLLLLTLGVAATLLLRFLEGNPTPYYMAPVERGDLRPQLTLPGLARMAGEVVVRAPGDATVTALPVNAGSQVLRDQALAVIDTGGFERVLAGDRSALAVAREQLAGAQQASEVAQARLARYSKVWNESSHRVPSFNEMESARAAADAAAIALRRQQAVLAAQQQRLHDDIAQMASALPRAPIDGIVVEQLLQPGTPVRAGQPLLSITPLGAPLHVVVPLDADLGKLPPGMPARVTLAATGGEYPATLLRVDTDAAGHQQAVFALPHTPGLPPSTPASVHMTLPLRRHVLLVPDAALAFARHCSVPRAGSNICVLGRDGTARSVDILAGPSDGQHTQILAGAVEPGQLAIIGWRAAPKTPPASAASAASAASSASSAQASQPMHSGR